MKAVVALLTLLAGPAAAQDFDPAMAEACLSAGRQAMRDGASVNDGLMACVGDAAQACEDRLGSPTTLDMNACRGAEADWWDGRLNATYGDLRRLIETREAGSEPGSEQSRIESLREMQRAWIGWRDAACAFEGDEYAGGTLAGTVRAGCLMQRTAHQALWLAGELDRLERQ